MKDQAIKKIESGLKSYKGDRYGQIMKGRVADALKIMCEKNEEFAQAVVQGGSFEDCMKACVKAVTGKSGDSDFVAYQAAAEFFFPGCVVECEIKIFMSKYEAEEPEQESVGVILRLEDFFV